MRDLCSDRLLRQTAVRVAAFLAAVFLIFLTPCFFHPPFLWGTTLRALCLALLAALCLYAGRLRGPEVKILFAFGIWLVLSRMLNGDIRISHETAMVLGFSSSFGLVALGGLLNREQRDKLLDVVSVVYCSFYMVLGIVCVIAGIFQWKLVLPVSAAELCSFGAENPRIIILGQNSNYTSFYFFLGFFFVDKEMPCACFSLGQCVYLRGRKIELWKIHLHQREGHLDVRLPIQHLN